MNRNTNLPNTGSYDLEGTHAAGLNTSSAQQPGVANTVGPGSRDRLGMHESTTAGAGRTQSDLSGNTPRASIAGSAGSTTANASGRSGGGGGSAGANVGDKVKGLFAQGHVSLTLLLGVAATTLFGW